MRSKLVEDKYIVYEDGRVYLTTRNRFIKPSINNKGYGSVKIGKKTVFVHRLVMETFVGKSNLTVDHIDGNKLNNNLSNLEYVTQKENNRRRDANLGYHAGSRANMKKVIYKGVIYPSAVLLSRELGLSDGTVSRNISAGYKVKGHKAEYYVN